MVTKTKHLFHLTEEVREASCKERILCQDTERHRQYQSDYRFSRGNGIAVLHDAGVLPNYGHYLLMKDSFSPQLYISDEYGLFLKHSLVNNNDEWPDDAETARITRRIIYK